MARRTPKPIIHARDHEHGGADPVRITWESVGGPGGGSPIDSTDNVGDTWGVHSAGPEPDGYVLTSDGAGGSIWLPSAAAGIQYNTDNEGGWLDIGTSGGVPTSPHSGVRFHADSGDADNIAVGIEATGSGDRVEGLRVTTENTGAGPTVGIAVSTGGNWPSSAIVASATGDANGVDIQSETGLALQITVGAAGGGGILINGDEASSPDILLLIASSVGNILQVTADGQVHMRNDPIVGPF